MYLWGSALESLEESGDRQKHFKLDRQEIPRDFQDLVDDEDYKLLKQASKLLGAIY